MISRRLVFIVLALTVSLAMVFLVRLLLKGQEARAESRFVSSAASRPLEARVLVAATTLPAGSVLRADSMRWQSWPKANLSDAYFTEGVVSLTSEVGGVVRSRVSMGEPLTAGVVSRASQGGSLAEVLTPGARGITINLSPSSGMAGFVRPGDRVDLILSTSHPSAGKDGRSVHVGETVLTNLRVVGMDQSLSDEASNAKGDKKEVVVPKTATLEVTPRQAEIVAVASDLGVLSLSLRSLAAAGDDTPAAATKVSEDDVTRRGLPTVAPHRLARSAAAPANHVNVYRGGVLDTPSPSLAMKAPT